MANLVLMPKLGFNMETGQIVQWHRKEGESIQKGEVLLEISTDKTVMEIESTYHGVVRKLLAEEGDTVEVIKPIAVIGEADENIDQIVKEAMAELGMTDASDKNEELTPAEGGAGSTDMQPSNQVPETFGATTEFKLTPKAKKLIEANNLDISKLTIPGTGFQGGVTAEDIQAYMKNNRLTITPLAEKIAQDNNIDAAAVKGSGIGGKVTKKDVLAALGQDVKEESSEVTSSAERDVLKRVNYTGMRKIIGDRLSQSMYTAPHLYFTTTVDMSDLMELRKKINAAQDIKVSINDFITGALSKALQEYPEMNSSLQGSEIIQYADINIGIAVGLESGLIVPVIRKAQTKRLAQIALESQALAEKAREGKLLPHEYQGGTFTISNLGMYGIENFTAIINPPEAAILAVSAVKKVPVVAEENEEDKIVIKPILNITLSVDHRIIDGMTATRFINRVKDLLEKPFGIIV